MSPDRASTESSKPLKVPQIIIIRHKNDAPDNIIQIIEENLFNGEIDNAMFLAAKGSPESWYKYLTKTSKLKDQFADILDSFEEGGNRKRYIYGVIADVARYLLSSEDYDTKVQNSYIESGLKRRKLPPALHLTLVECLPNCHEFINNHAKWNLDKIKLELAEGAKKIGIEIDLEFFTRRYLRAYLFHRVFPFYPELKLPRSPIDEDFWEENKDILEGFVIQKKTGFVKDVDAVIAYIETETGTKYSEKAIDENFRKFRISIERSGLSVEKVNTVIENLRALPERITRKALAQALDVEPITLDRFCKLHQIEYTDDSPKLTIEQIREAINTAKTSIGEISWDSVAQVLGLHTTALKRICQQLDISIIDEEEVQRQIIQSKEKGMIATSESIARELGYAFKTINDALGEKEGFKLSVRNAITKAIDQVKYQTNESLVYRSLLRTIISLIDANPDRIRRLMTDDNINIFTIDEINQAISMCSQDSKEVNLKNVASILRTDSKTLLRDLKILGYDLESLGIQMEG